jgi:hypothetical protein
MPEGPSAALSLFSGASGFFAETVIRNYASLVRLYATEAHLSSLRKLLRKVCRLRFPESVATPDGLIPVDIAGRVIRTTIEELPDDEGPWNGLGSVQVIRGHHPIRKPSSI